MTDRAPILQRPIYLSGGGAADLPAPVQDVCRKAAPFMGLVGATLFGATAAYFVPKILDRMLGNSGDQYAPDSAAYEAEAEDLDYEG